MAIYKPSNSTPFLSTVDLTVAQYLECEIHTSNVPITGYKLRLLDGNNDVVFEGAEYSDISLDSVLNGSALKVPLVIVGAVPTTNSNPNAFYYTNEKYYSSENIEISNFYNGYTKQPYKWQITLCQGTPVGSPDEQWYDMLVTSGVTMGSNKDRIQGPVSNEIYMDYYVQLYEEKPTEDNKSSVAVGLRALISSYDSTNGYIYPYFGSEGLEEEYVEKANYFQVFKDTNNPEYVSSSRMVDYATTVSMDTISVGGVTAKLTLSENTSYQSVQKYEGITYEAFEGFQPYIGNYDTGVTGSSVLTLDDTTLLIKNESTEIEEDTISPSARNGIYTYQGKSWEYTDEDETVGTMTVTWQRTSAARSWANFIGQAFYVVSGSSSGINYDTNATSGGVINSTSLVFTEEKAIDLYPDLDGTEDYGVDYGPVYKNTKEITYLRPFIGLTEGMRLYYTDTENIEQYLDIASVDTSSWGVSFIGKELETPFTTPFETGVDYEIRSFLKVGDENPFYGYAIPTLGIDIGVEGEDYDAGTEIYTLRKRTLSPIGTYSQNSNQSWKNYTWTLIDDTLNYTYPSTTVYTGNIEGYFQGLLDGHSYTLQLAVEDNFGRTVEAQIYILVNLATKDLFPMTIEFDCNTQSVWLDFSQAGVVVPTPLATTDEAGELVEGNGISYDEGEVTIENDANNFVKGQDSSLDPDLEGAGLRYENVLLLGKITAPLSGPKTESFTLNSQHTKISEHYEGALFEKVIKIQDTNYLIKLLGVLPQSVVTDLDGTRVENANRNTIEVLYYESNNNGQTWELRNIENYIAKLTLSGYLVNPEETDTWRDNLPIVYSWTAPGTDADPSCDYLNTTHPYTEQGRAALSTYADEFLSTLENETLLDMLGDIFWGVDESLYNLPSDFFNSSGSMEFPLNTTTETGDNVGIWIDRQTTIIKQADETLINVYVEEETFQTWNDSTLYWCDYGVENGELYIQSNINEETNHSGRQDIVSKTLTFNIAVENYDPTLTRGITVSSKVFIEETNTD